MNNQRLVATDHATRSSVLKAKPSLLRQHGGPLLVEVVHHESLPSALSGSFRFRTLRRL